MRSVSVFNYGQWTVTIEVKSVNEYLVNDHRADLYCAVDCTGNWNSTQGLMYDYGRDCVAYNEPEILPKGLKKRIFKVCQKKLLYGLKYKFSDIQE